MRNGKKTVQDTTVMRRYEYRIYPSETQADLFVRTFGCVRFVFNKLLREKIDHYRKTEKMLVNTPAHLKVDFPWLSDVDSYALCNAQLDLQSAFIVVRRRPVTLVMGGMRTVCICFVYFPICSLLVFDFRF